MDEINKHNNLNINDKALNNKQDKDSLFTSFFENNKAIMLKVNAETKQIADANKAAIRFYNFPKNELLKKTIYDLHTLSPSEINKLMKKALEKKFNFFQFKHRIAGNKIKDVEVYSSSVKQNGKIYMILTVYDITERKKIENQLKESQQLLKEAQRISKLGHWELDLIKNKLIWSDEIYRIFGIKPQEFKANYEFFLDTIHPEDREMVNNAYINSLKTKTAYEIEHRLLLKSGELKYVVERCNTEFDKNGKALRSIGTVQDITKRKKIDLEIKKRNQELKKLNATKDKFFSIIAHDLKGPFNSILGFSELLSNNFEKYDTKEQKKFIEIIQESMQNTYKLLENLLLWSRSQRGTIDFKPQKLNLFLLIEETVNVLSPTAVNKSITLNNKISKNFFVFADRNMLLTICRNLISNAIKFTRKGGNVTIKARIINTENKVDSVEVTVIDNGVGISKKRQALLFKISEHVSTEGTENEEGTGLGLILCKEFIEKNNGKIWVESKKNKGSKFIFTLPLA